MRCDAPCPVAHRGTIPRHQAGAGRCGYGDGMAEWRELRWINVPAWRSPEKGVWVDDTRYFPLRDGDCDGRRTR